MLTWSPQQETALRAIEEWLKGSSPTFVLKGFAGTGKCQPLTSQVMTPTGWVAIGSLKVGDVISDPSSGRTQFVEGVYPQGIKEVWQVTFRDGSTVQCNDEHLWRVRQGRHGFKTCPLQTIIKQGVLWPSGAHRFQIPLACPVESAGRNVARSD